MSHSNDPAAARFKGFCFDYDKYRPTPPDELIELAAKWAGPGKPDLVVDLGCGTGLSTRPWAEHAVRVIGIDPSRDMLEAALKGGGGENLSYREGLGNATGMGPGTVDVVSCSSAIHWMEPASTVLEVGRILKPGGVFLVYGHYYPVIMESPSLTRFYEVWRKNLDHLEYKTEQQGATKWPLRESIGVFEASKTFKYVRKHFMHSRLAWNAVDLEGFFRAHAGVHFLAGRGYDDETLLFNELRALLEAHDRPLPFHTHFTYSVFLGVKG